MDLLSKPFKSAPAKSLRHSWRSSMRKPQISVLAFLAVFCVSLGSEFAFAKDTEEPASPKAEWTFLVYLNGNNNLDSFGTMNLKQMEQIGSTPEVNVVVQWASLKNRKTQRLLIEKDMANTSVSSPIVQDLGQIDMGSAKTLLEFIQWGIKKYPAKHYVVDVWDHGSGWHAIRNKATLTNPKYHTTDISWDDNTGHSISTRQLADVLRTVSKQLGRKIDLYGSDACLMGMTEIANEMVDSVDTYVGSEEVEAAAGWPYHKILGALVQHPQMNSKDLGKVISDEFVSFYMAPENQDQGSATFSAFDLSKMNVLDEAILQLGVDLLTIKPADRRKIITAVSAAQRFTFDDYADLTDVLAQLESMKDPLVRTETITTLKRALGEFIITYGSTPALPKAYGASIWFPTNLSTYNQYASQYRELNFESQTNWNEALKHLLN